MTAATHPTDQELQAFANGELRYRLAKPIEDHITNCNACVERLLELGPSLTNDPLVRLVSDAMALDFEDTPFPQPLVECPNEWQNHPRFAVRYPVGHTRAGTCYLARDRETQGTVVVSKVSQFDVYPRLESLAQTMRAHPTIGWQPITSLSRTDDALIVAIHHESGMSLREMICSRGRLEHAELLQHTQAAAEILDAAHARHVTHGELTLEDWVLVDDGLRIRGWERARYGPDFTLDARVDQAAFGRCVLGMLVGKTTLTAANVMPFNDVWPDTPADATAVLRKMIAAEYPSIRDAATAFNATFRTRSWWTRWTRF